MKLAAIFTVFNGTELLPGAIRQIENYVHTVLISWQKISNKGIANNYLTHDLNKLSMSRSINCMYFDEDKAKKLDFIEYTPDLSTNTKENERRKLNQAIQYLKQKGYTHFILLACDHYYHPEELKWAIKEGQHYDVTLTKMYTYFKHPTWQLDPPEEYHMPFICKIHPDTCVVKQEYDCMKTDPSVRINTRKTIREFTREEISLHHYSAVRSDIKNKFRNAAASIRWTPEMIKGFEDEFENYDIETNPGIKYFGGRKIKVVPNYFNISLNAPEPATPNLI